MSRFEERNNEDKEEVLEFGTEEGAEVRMLGCWMGWEKDVQNRIARARKAWYKVKPRLIGSKLSKRMQARVVEACVESTLLFDCHVRVWYVKELKKLQKFMDQIYRYIWSRKTKPPTMQMEEEGKRMQDLWAELGVKSIRWKVEKRILERIGHVMRMEDGRMTKAVILGWMEELEGRAKPSGRRRKTILYWKRLMREAGMDTTDVGNLTKDRKEWKRLVRNRMEHLGKYERSQGHKWTGEAVVRNQAREKETVFICGVCEKRCKSKGGLVNHRRKMHERSVLKKTFECKRCKLVFVQESNLKNHAKICGGAEALDKNRRLCLCGKDYSKGYFPKHSRQCDVWLAAQNGVAPQAARAAADPRLYKDCPLCGRNMRKDNLARHIREACPGQ